MKIDYYNLYFAKKLMLPVKWPLYRDFFRIIILNYTFLRNFLIYEFFTINFENFYFLFLNLLTTYHLLLTSLKYLIYH